MNTVDTFIMENQRRMYRHGPFPWKLHEMLEIVDRAGMSHIIGWNERGDEFAVYDPKAFARSIMPHFFNQSKYKSFQRQLNLYLFHRRRDGPTLGIYSHPQFLRDQPIQALKIRRTTQVAKPSHKSGQRAHAQLWEPVLPTFVHEWPDIKATRDRLRVPESLASTPTTENPKERSSVSIFCDCPRLEGIGSRSVVFPGDDLSSIGTIEIMSEDLLGTSGTMAAELRLHDVLW